MDYNWELGRLKETGKYVLGRKETLKLLKKGQIKAVVYSSEPHFKSEYGKLNVKKYESELNSMQMGAVFGKPFSVSIVGIIEPGSSALKGD